MVDMKHPWARTKPFRVACNMFFCAVLFSWWVGVYPRETISGLFGRKAFSAKGENFWTIGARVIDSWHPLENAHCMETFVLEEHARAVLYQCSRS